MRTIDKIGVILIIGVWFFVVCIAIFSNENNISDIQNRLYKIEESIK